MKVLHITNAYPIDVYGSFGIFIKEQIDSLNKKGIINEVFFINAWEKGKFEYLRIIPKIKKISKDYDILHYHHIYSGFSGLLSFVNKPYIISILGDIRQINGPLERIFKLISPLLKGKIIYKYNHKYKSQNYIYLPNGVDIDVFKPIEKKKAKLKLKLDIDKKFALFVSAFGINNKIKRHDKFIATLKALENDGIKLFPLYLVDVKRDLVPYYYNSSDIVLVTSDHEGSPNAVKEALACNIPIVSTNVGNVHQMLNNCNGCYVAKNNSTDELKKLVALSLKCKNFNGRENLKKLGLDINSVADKLMKIYEMELERRHVK